MKILYVASERSRAQVATRALRAISPNVTVLWGSSYERAAFTILENPDLAALVLEVQSDTQGSSYLKQLQTLGLQAPVVMVLPEGANSPTESIKAGANDYLAKGPSFLQELPAVLTRTIGRVEMPELPVVVPADRRPTHTGETERRTRDLDTSVQQTQRSAAEQSAAAGRQARLEMLLHQEREVRTGLEQKLTDVKAALQQAEQRYASATTAAAQQSERNTQYETGMARAAATQKMLEEQLRQSRQSRVSAAADVERLTLRNTELSSMLTEATGTRKALESRLADIETALEAANERASSERSGADERSAARQTELHAQLEREVAKRRSVEEELARVKRAYDEAEKQRSSVVTSATALWAERQSQFETELAAAAEARNTLGRDARQLETALEQARQTIQAHAGSVERLTQREAELAAQLAEAAAIRTTLEQRLTDATTALKDADEGASRNRLAAATRAAERELDLERSVRQERAARADVEGRLAHAEAALRDAEQQHTSAMTTAATQRAEREAQFDNALANAAETRNTLGHEARQLAAEVGRLTQRESELTSQLADAAATGRSLEQQLAAAADALNAADKGVSQERAARADVEGRLMRAEAALREATQQHASAITAAATKVDRLTQGESELTSQLADAAAVRSTLERQLTDAQTALKQASDAASRDYLALETKAAERTVEFDRLIRQERAARADVDGRLVRVEAAFGEAERQHSAAMTAAASTVDRLTQREAELTSQLADAAAAQRSLEQQLTAAADALNAADKDASRDRLAAETKTAEREVEFDRLIRQERAVRANVEGRLAQVEAALRDAQEHYASALTAAASEQAERQARFELELSQTAATRDEFKRRHSDAEVALAAARQDHAAAATEVERRTQHERALTSQLAEAAAMRSTLEQQLTDAATALREANESASRDRLALETQATERTAEFDRLIRGERAVRANVEGRLAQVEAALRDAQEQHTSVMAAAASEQAERRAEFELELSQTAATRDEFKRRHSDAEAALAAARQDHAAAATEVERRTQHERALTSQLAEVAAARSALEQQLTDAATALREANESASRDRLALEAQATERTAEFDRLIRQERSVRANVEGRLAQVEAALRDAQEQHASALTAAASEHAERRAEFELELSQTAATRDEFKRRHSDAEAALAAARQDHAAAATEVERRTQRETALTSQLAEAAAMRSTLEQQLTDAATALRDANDVASRDRLTAATKAAEREVEFDRLIGDERAARADVEGQLAQVEAALRDAQQQHTSAMATATAERAERQAEFDAELARVSEARDTLDGEARQLATEVKRLTQRETALTSELAHVEAALRDAEQQHTSAMAAAATERAKRQAEFDAELARVTEARDTLDGEARQLATEVKRLTQRETALTSELAHVDAALRDAHQQHTSAMAAAAKERAERQAQFDAELARITEARDTLDGKARELSTEVERLAQRETALTSELAHVETALHNAAQQHTSAMAAAATDRAERQAQFELELSQTAATRDEFKHRFNDAETALAASRRDHAAAASEVERLTEREAALTAHLGEAAEMRSALEQQLTDGAAALRDAHEGASRDRLAAETKAAERAVEFEGLIGHERAMRADVEGRLAQETARREGLDGEVAQMRAAAADAEQRYREEIAALTARGRHEVTQLESQFAKEREANHERQARLLNDIQNLEAARGALDESLTSLREQSRLREIDHHNEREALDRARLTAETDGRRLAAELAEARSTLEAARRDFQQTLDRTSSEHADSQAKLVATVAERDARIEDVEKQLDGSERELRRQFQHAPLALWRCTRDGALTDANQVLANLVGYSQSEELRRADFVKTVFESADDLSWLIERCLTTKTRQSVETAWKRRNGEHIVVRLSAVESPPDMIEIAVEDVTNARVLQDRLAHAHRMEAVARLASEIAITCGRLLGDVHEDGQQWLMEVSAENALRKRGERLLGEIARAASYLERIAAHGDEQTSALKPVELNKVLRDLKPVLKHVAGDDVDIELSKTSSVLNVDMKADRVERLLVNLASYGRERMPAGGRLKIELATVVVDQKFIADHPNVRRGHHALITVTAMRREVPTAATLHSNAIEPGANEVVSEKPGVDLGALQELLQECGGHLWLTVDPPGNMVVKLRLPLRVWDDRPHSSTSDTPTTRKSVMGRLFRH